MSEYAPELLKLFLQASKREVRISLDSKQDAIRLRFRLHNLRRALRRQGHESLSTIEGVSLSVKENELIAHPKDSIFVRALHLAGITGGEEIKIQEPISEEQKEELDEINKYLRIEGKK